MEGMHTYAVNRDRIKCYIVIGLISVFLTPCANHFIHDIKFLNHLEPWMSAGPSFGVIYGILFGLYNKIGWKLKILHLVGLPKTTNLNGKYTGKLTSSYKVGTEVPLNIEIVQDWTKIVVYTETGTDTSRSYSYMASLFEVDGTSAQLTYSYTNKPFSAIADTDMQPHDGTASLVFRSSGKIKGTYFNARKRIGTIRLSKFPR